MTRVNLRDYLLEIDDQIENGRADEAIAHCRYIIELYPKHIETYRLLGKSYLETQRYSDAADVLQRVLSSLPDDFISHLGMSIIREDEGNLDAAIWHMERAFEVQPSNVAIQEELRRLYGRRDGLEPNKIHLTRGALARMYAKGDLYEQAIAEIRTTLAEEHQRTDLQILLARMYALNGQRVEAIKTSSNILQNFPNCKEALQILVEILPESQRAAEAQNYHLRLQALDPYAAHISQSITSADDVPDHVITLERHEWTPDHLSSTTNTRPDWAASLGVDIGLDASDEERLPDWLTSVTEKTPAFEDEPAVIESLTDLDEKNEEPSLEPFEKKDGETLSIPESTDESSEAEEQIPEWMKSVGWKLADDTSDGASDFTSLDEDEEFDLAQDDLVPADIPDWLQTMAPSTDSERQPSESGKEIPEGEPLTWLDEKTPGATDSIVNWLQTKDQSAQEEDSGLDVESDTESETPERLMELDESSFDQVEDHDASESLEEFTPEPLIQAGADSSPDDDIPDWLGDLGERSPTEAIPEVLDLGEDSSEVTEQPPAEPTPVDAVSAWLQTLADETPAEGELEPLDIAAEDSDASVPPSAEPDEVEKLPEWLQSLGEETPEQLLEEDVPEWVKTLSEEVFTTEEAPEPTLPTKIGEIDMADEDKIPELSPEFEDETMAWLESLAAKQGVDEEELLTTSEERDVSPPEWVQQLATEPELIEEEAPTEAITPNEAATFVDGAIDLEAATVSEDKREPVGESEENTPDVPDWLQDLVGEAEPAGELPVSDLQFTPEETEKEKVVSADDTLPEWIHNLAEDSPESIAEPILEEPPIVDSDTQPTKISIDDETETPPSIETEIPDWIKDAETTEPTFSAVEETVEVEDEISEWIEEDVLKESVGVIEPEQPIASETIEEEPEIPAWLSVDEIEEPDDAVAVLEQPLEAAAVTEEPETTPRQTEAQVEEIVQAVESEGPIKAEIMEEEPEIPEWLSVEEMEKPTETLTPDQPLEDEIVEEEPEIPKWLKVEEVEEPIETLTPEQPLEAEIVEDEPEIPESVAAEEVAEEIEEAQPIRTIETEIVKDQLEPTEEVVLTEEPEEVTEEMEFVEAAILEEPDDVPEIEVSEAIEDEILSAPVDLNTASFKALERLPGIGPVMTQTIIDHRTTHGFFADVDAILDVPGIGPKTLAVIRNLVIVETFEEPIMETGSLKETILVEGRGALDNGDITKAYELYSELIDEELYLDDVINDLVEAQYHYPVEVSIYELLGDAYMRSDRIQDALDTYTKAEELLS